MMKELNHRSSNETHVRADSIRPCSGASILRYTEGNHHE